MFIKKNIITQKLFFLGLGNWVGLMDAPTPVLVHKRSFPPPLNGGRVNQHDAWLMMIIVGNYRQGGNDEYYWTGMIRGVPLSPLRLSSCLAWRCLNVFFLPFIFVIVFVVGG